MIPTDKKEHETPTSIVLDILSEKPRLTVKDLFEFYQSRTQKKMTLQGFYKLLSQLLKQQVVVKEGKIISLDASWIYNLMKFSDKVKRLFLGREAYAFNVLLREGEKKDFIFETVKDMDNFWHHALFLVVQYYRDEKYSDKHAYVYTEHGWFQIVRTNMESSLARLYAENNMRVYQVIGSNSFLDSLVEKTMTDDNYHAMQNAHGKFGENYYCMVIGDFIFETALPNYIHEQMEHIYQNVKNISEFNAQDILMLINQPGRTTLTISRNKKRAQTIREEIKRCFAKEELMGRISSNT